MNNSKLLFDEEPLIIMPQLAAKIGLNESIILQQIHYWIQINKKANKNFNDGYYWTFNTYEDWGKQFPFWSVRTIERTIDNLKKMKLIITANYNKFKADRTVWYRIDYDNLSAYENQSFGHNVIMYHSDKLSQPIPETKEKSSKKYTNKQLTAAYNLAAATRGTEPR